MLETPLGFLYVYINNEPIEYELIKLPLKPIEISSYEVDFRYLIEFNKEMIKAGDILTFCIDTNIEAQKDGGDCLVEAMFESDEVFLALGGYDINNSNYNNSNYFISAIKNGLKIDYTMQPMPIWSICWSWVFGMVLVLVTLSMVFTTVS